MNTTRFLVTGATGFIGSHFTELVLTQGCEAVCPVRNLSELRNLKGIPAKIIRVADLERETRDGPGFDYVIHLAGATRAPDYDGYRVANVELTRRLLELFALKRSDRPLKRFVLVSSQAAAGPSRDNVTPVKESDTPLPVSQYGRSKLEGEKVALEYLDRIPVTVVRPPAVFGPRDTDFLGIFRSALFRLEVFPAGPDRLVSIIYVEDLARGILAAGQSEQSVGQTYFLANPEWVVWREFCLKVARLMGKPAVAVPIPNPIMKMVALAGDLVTAVTGKLPLIRSDKLEEIKQIAWICDTGKARTELDWSPEFTIDRAIVKTAQWYKENRWI